MCAYILVDSLCYVVFIFFFLSLTIYFNGIKKMVDYQKIPLVALSSETKFLLSSLLNPTKIIPTDEGLPRDWRGLADAFSLGGEMIPSICSHSDPTSLVLETVSNKNSKCMIKELQEILERLNRWDIIDDAAILFEKDARKYLERVERCEREPEALNNDVDNQMLTFDDLHRARAGLGTQLYDAFLLYADEDSDFIGEITENLEKQNNLKLCIKDRDLMTGVTFEHNAVIQLISERCNRLLVVLSPNFSKSPANKFFLNYAQAIGIEKSERKIIPCMYKECELPTPLKYTYVLRYNTAVYYNFWGRLQDSVRTIKSNSTIKSVSTSQTMEVQLTEDDSPMKNIDKQSKETKEDKKVNDTCSVTCETPKEYKPMKLLPWSLKKTSKPRETSENSSLNNENPVVHLPTLEDLDSLESTSDPTNNTSKTKTKKKAIKIYAKQLKALILKS